MGKSFAQQTPEERAANLAKANARKAELRAMRKAGVTPRDTPQQEARKLATVANYEAALPEPPPVLVSDADWRDHQGQLRELTPKAMMKLGKLLDSQDERVLLAAVKEVLDRRWDKPTQVQVQENVNSEVVYHSTVLDAMKN